MTTAVAPLAKEKKSVNCYTLESVAGGASEKLIMCFKQIALAADLAADPLQKAVGFVGTELIAQRTSRDLICGLRSASRFLLRMTPPSHATPHSTAP